MERNRENQVGTASSDESVEHGASMALTLDEVQAVLQKAAQIDAREPVSPGSALTVEELTRVAMEAGISPEAIRKAVREVALGRLGTGDPQTLLDRVFGTRWIMGARVAEISADRATARVQRVLVDELFEVAERREGRIVWEPVRGARAGVLRAVRKVWTGRGDLRQMQIISDVRPADGSGKRALISLEVRFQDRGKYLGTPLAIGGISGLGAAVLAAVGFSELAQHAAAAAELFVASVATAGSGATITLGLGALLARGWRKRVDRARQRLQHLLDEVTGEAPIPNTPSVLEILRR